MIAKPQEVSWSILPSLTVLIQAQACLLTEMWADYGQVTNLKSKERRKALLTYSQKSGIASSEIREARGTSKPQIDEERAEIEAEWHSDLDMAEEARPLRRPG